MAWCVVQPCMNWTRPQADKAFGDRIATFESYRKRFDPTDRLLNDYFRKLVAVEEPALGTTPQGVSGE